MVRRSANFLRSRHGELSPVGTDANPHPKFGLLPVKRELPPLSEKPAQPPRRTTKCRMATHRGTRACTERSKAGRLIAVYDILQGEGGEVNYPVPWARDPAISHPATSAEMRLLLQAAGFRILDEIDSTEQSEVWFKEAAAKLSASGKPPVGLRHFLGDDATAMTRNQVRNLAERRIRTLT
jgi:hypothetical protein